MPSLRAYYLTGLVLIIIGGALALAADTIPNTWPATITISLLMLGAALMSYVIGRVMTP